ncbi:unnamed protein product, partial [Ectocarpus sp. 6 AP-2014]
RLRSSFFVVLLWSVTLVHAQRFSCTCTVQSVSPTRPINSLIQDLGSDPESENNLDTLCLQILTPQGLRSYSPREHSRKNSSGWRHASPRIELSPPSQPLGVSKSTPYRTRPPGRPAQPSTIPT